MTPLTWAGLGLIAGIVLTLAAVIVLIARYVDINDESGYD